MLRRHNRRNTLKKTLAIIWGVQLVIVIPWFLGAIVRGEQSLFVWVEYQRQLRRFGMGDALFMVYLYIIFYSPLLLMYFAHIPRIFRKSVNAKLVQKALDFAQAQQNLRPRAKLEGIFYSRKEADEFLMNKGTADVMISNPDQDVFLLFSGKREAAEAEAEARRMNAPIDMASLNAALNKIRPKR